MASIIKPVLKSSQPADLARQWEIGVGHTTVLPSVGPRSGVHPPGRGEMHRSFATKNSNRIGFIIKQIQG